MKAKNAVWGQPMRYPIGRTTVLCGIAAAMLLAGTAQGQCERQALMAAYGEDGDYFGAGMAWDGDVAIIGAPGDDDNHVDAGSVSVFRFDGDVWTEEVKLLTSDGGPGDFFGRAIAIDGNVAIIGAYRDDDNGTDSGSAYVFRYNGSEWVEEAKLLASDGTEEDEFGKDVAISGDIVAVGAWQFNQGSLEVGKAYLYRYDGSQWVEEAQVKPASSWARDFGHSVALEGDVLVGGSPGYYIGEGAVFVFRHDGSSWVEEATLESSSPYEDRRFGYSVALCGDVIVAGEEEVEEDWAAAPSVYVFRYDGSSWNEEAELQDDSPSHDRFGRSVAVKDDVILVGASKDGTAVTRGGAAVAFGYDGYHWEFELKLLGSDILTSDGFGNQVVLGDGVAMIGAAYHDETGAAYFFEGVTPDSDCNDNDLDDDCEVFIGLAEDCQFNGIPDWCDIDTGTSEDVNNDGVPDECAYLAGHCPGVEVKASDAIQSDSFGRSVAVGGDLALVGRSEGDGAAYVLRYDGSSWNEEAKLEAWDSTGGAFGRALGIDGDVAVVGVGGDDEYGENAGAVYVFRHDGADWLPEAKLSAGSLEDLYFGGSVHVCGDRIAVGASGYFDNPEIVTGCGYVYRYSQGLSSGRGAWVQEAQLLASDGIDGDEFGGAISMSGDALIVGADGDEIDSGSAYVFRYADGTWTEEAKLRASDAESWDRFGCDVSIHEDVAIIGARNDEDLGDGSGSAYIFRCEDGIWSEEAKLLEPNGKEYHHFGNSVAMGEGVAGAAVMYMDDWGNYYGTSRLFRYAGGGVWLYLDGLNKANSIAIDGDVTIVGDPRADQYYGDGGAVHMYHGSIGVDCNFNGIADGCDIHSGYSEDLNNNGIPDECDVCPEDVNGDEVVNIDDLFQVLNVWGACDDCPEDINDDGVVDIDDVFAVLSAWGPCW